MHRRLLVTVALLIAATLVALFILFASARLAVNEEWRAKLGTSPRSPQVVRGLLSSMIGHPESHPSFLPHSAWDNDVCAGNVVSAVNFLLGEERLTDAPAWLFEQANQGKIDRIYAREPDFVEEEGRIVELYDRGFGLSGILDMVGSNGNRTAGRMYVIGYHYRETTSDQTILAARDDGGTLNSHLLLLLGRHNNRWWGYHFYHDPSRPKKSPFEVIDMGECARCENCSQAQRCMPAWFDLIYIWEIRNTQLPLQGSPVLLVQNSVPYEAVTEVVGSHGSGRFDHVVDTILSARAPLGDHFATVVPTDKPFEMPTPTNGGWHGEILGFYNGLPIKRQVGESQRGIYGLEYQCVEFVNRFYAEMLDHRNMTRSGDADSYWFGACDKGLVRFENGQSEPPEQHDILVFDLPGSNTPGHIGIVTDVFPDRVCIVQQNAPQWRECFVLEVRGGRWHVTGTFADMKALGWSRLSQLHGGKP